uniref:Uncharacterized protein n=1 Tax=Rhizophagus irregularis (strain DAOM 181602 / DAOM 197198 / MUCL 43194) TaxID=747089 RepID=U9TIP8_RHIID
MGFCSGFWEVTKFTGRVTMADRSSNRFHWWSDSTSNWWTSLWRWQTCKKYRKRDGGISYDDDCPICQGS